MKIPELRWPTEKSTYDDDLVLEVMSGTVVLLIRGRNAWHSTWVRHYYKNAHLYGDIPSAKQAAERQRGPGNVFYIVEAPALLLCGQRTNAVLCDAHPDNPFGAFTGFDVKSAETPLGTWVDGVYPGVSVRDAVTAFRHYSGHWSGPHPDVHSLRTGALETIDLFDTSRGAMKSLTSRAVGSNYYLQWVDSPTRYARRGADAIERRWRVSLSRTGAPDLTSTQRLRHYRDKTLKVMPKTQWLEKRQSVFRRLTEADEVVARLDDLVTDAEIERDRASRARMSPAATAAGLREQRERFERAMAEIDRLRADLARAESEAHELWRLAVSIRSDSQTRNSEQ
ncbi:hypothetical protein [Aeromicrobium duanguangcaii]|uniref:hypothetical protein n=1 Tax=Aeromicrobium duanguangcaii TaxID=2968086 RepID=UPI002017241B|nr:hypothetical protein [Aeromicrobium duanguangcaii]MCL3836273.1 hypothetical protein [Aeromicrobium duanguangcaii]